MKPSRIYFTIGLGALLGCLAAPVAQGELLNEVSSFSGSPPTQEVMLAPGQSSLLEFTDPIDRVSINDESVAEVVVVTPTVLVVNGKKPGTTSMIVWRSNANEQFTLTTVGPPRYWQGEFTKILRKLLPEEENLVAYESSDTIILAGQAKHPANVEKATKAAGSAAKQVVNITDLLDSKQVLIEVRFAEVDRTLAKSLGIDYITQSRNVTQSGFTGGVLTPQTPSTPSFGRIDPKDILLSSAVKSFLEWRTGSVDLAVAINALEQKGMIRTLAEPNLLAMSGECANFLAGGEFPIPVPQNNGAIAIEFKEFGIRLDFKPEVTANDMIRLSVAPEVSVLDFGASSIKIGGFQIPGLITRRAKTTVEIRSGESLVIGGLLSQMNTRSNDQVPFMGELPILGKLFSSEKFKNEETELLVLVTPRLTQAGVVEFPERYKNTEAIEETFRKYPPAPYPDEEADRLRRAIGVPEQSAAGPL